MPGKCSFRNDWMNDKRFQKWLQPVEGDKYKAYCALCNSKFDITHSGIFSLRTHAKGSKHKRLAGALSSGQQTTLPFSPEVEQGQSLTSEINISQQSSGSSNKTVPGHLNNFVIKDQVTKAEIIWVFYRVMSQTSDRSAAKASRLFAAMFPDSSIAEKFTMQKDKLAYSVSYGLGPYFQNELCREVRQKKFFCISVDESLNKIAQKSQMDLIVRYWDFNKNEVCTRYLTSAFLGHTTAPELLTGFTSAMEDLGLPLKNLLQVLTDGPNVNLKFHRELKSFLKSETYEGNIIDVGTCILHIVHNAYKEAHKKSQWNINKFLRCIYYLFKDFPSRKADYIFHSKSNVFALKMCSTRWVENVAVIARAITMLPFLKIYIEAVSKKPPQSENFEAVKKFLSDELLLAKLTFLQSVALQLEPFLTQFQADKPLLPFLHGEYYQLMHSIAFRFIKKCEMDKVRSYQSLLNLDFQDPNNHKNIREIDIGFGTVAACKNVSEGAKLNFFRDCKTVFISLYKKMLDKSPLKNQAVRGAACLSPAVMLTSDLKITRLDCAVKELLNNGLINGCEADSIKRIYIRLTNNEEFQIKLKSFSMKNDKIDEFFMKNLDFVQNAPECEVKAFTQFIQIIFIMFHGNAAVERSFSANKEFLVENLHEQSLISLRAVHSAISAAGGILDLEITKSMISAFCASSSKRVEALKSKQNKEIEEANAKNMALQRLKELKAKKRMLELQAKEEANALQEEINIMQKKIKST